MGYSTFAKAMVDTVGYSTFANLLRQDFGDQGTSEIEEP